MGMYIGVYLYGELILVVILSFRPTVWHELTILANYGPKYWFFLFHNIGMMGIYIGVYLYEELIPIDILSLRPIVLH